MKKSLENNQCYMIREITNILKIFKLNILKSICINLVMVVNVEAAHKTKKNSWLFFVEDTCKCNKNVFGKYWTLSDCEI